MAIKNNMKIDFFMEKYFSIKHKFNWEYCECGCKGYSLTIFNIHYWVYWNLKNTYTLYNGHGHNSTLIKKCKSFDEVNSAMINHQHSLLDKNKNKNKYNI